MNTGSAAVAVKRSITKVQETLSRNLINLRDEKGVSIDWLVEKSGVGRNTIYDMFHMRHEPSVVKVERIANAVGLEAWHLLMSDIRDMQLLELIAVWSTASDNGRQLIRLAVQAAKQEK